MAAKTKDKITCGRYINRRTQRIPLDRFHIAYTRRIITTVIEIMVQGKELIIGYSNSRSAALRKIANAQIFISNVTVPLEHSRVIMIMWRVVNQSTYTYRTNINTNFNQSLVAYVYRKVINDRQGAKQKN